MKNSPYTQHAGRTVLQFPVMTHGQMRGMQIEILRSLPNSGAVRRNMEKALFQTEEAIREEGENGIAVCRLIDVDDLCGIGR